jgi:hypothetical protein
MEDLVKEADAIVAVELEDRKKQREAEDTASSTNAKLGEITEDGETEVSSNP